MNLLLHKMYLTYAWVCVTLLLLQKQLHTDILYYSIYADIFFIFFFFCCYD